LIIPKPKSLLFQRSEIKSLRGAAGDSFFAQLEKIGNPVFESPAK
jgi:hypothetical protein